MRISNINALTLGEQAQQKNQIQQNQDFAKILSKASEEKDEKALKSAAQDLEAVFIKMMLDAMRKTVHDDGLIAKSNGEKIFESMLDQEYAQELTKAGGIGLSDIIVQQLSQQ